MGQYKVEHERETVEVWPDGSKIEVDKWRTDSVAPWIYGKYEVYCGTCCEVVAEVTGEPVALLKYLSHAVAEMQKALMELSYYTGRGERRSGT